MGRSRPQAVPQARGFLRYAVAARNSILFFLASEQESACVMIL